MKLNHSIGTMGKRNTKYLFAALVTIGTVVIILSLYYVSTIKKSMEGGTDRYLSEISNHVASMINYRIESSYQTLRTTARACEQIDDQEPLLDYLKLVSEENEFNRISYTDDIGTCYVSNGNVSTIDIENHSSIKDALEGREGMSDPFKSKIDGKESLLYVVPVYRGNQVVGSLSGTRTTELLRDLMNVESFGGKGFSHIIDLEGDFVIQSDNPNAIAEHGDNFTLLEQYAKLDKGYSLNNMKANMEAGRSGILRFQGRKDGMHRTVVYVNLDIPKWYLLSVVPTAVAEEKIRQAINLSISNTFIMVTLFIGVLVLLYVIYRRSNQSLEKLAFADTVTGGDNRMKFELDAGSRIKEASSYTYAVVSLDIQKFKLINDSFGTLAGNLTLKYISGVLQGELKEGELAARMAGDVFSLLLYNTDPEDLGRRLDYIVSEINSFNSSQEHKYYLYINQGIYIVDDKDLDIIVIQDRANVARKSNSENSAKLVNRVFYSDLERIRLVREKEINNRMGPALKNREFAVYLQPKVELKRDSIVGAEALVRWNDPERGLIMPGEFIPVLEDSGLIVQLDLYVFEEACRMLSRWIKAGVNPVPISVNLSRVNLEHPDFLNLYRKVYEKYDIPPALLEFEWTETLVFDNKESLLKVIDEIHEIGFKCSMDDFGSGYSSLNMLKDVPVDILKLDRAFFRGAMVKRGESVIEGVIELARKLEMETVAEGIETNAQLEFLRNAQCDMVQGYIFSKPVPLDVFERLAFERDLDIE